MKLNRKAAAFLAAMLVATTLAGCGSSEGQGGSTANNSGNSAANPYDQEKSGDQVELAIYMIGEGPTDQQMAVDAINEKMKEEINATINIKNTPWADWNTKYQLLFNSGEDFEGCFATGWADYAGIAKKGGFYELNQEMLETYMPNFAPQLFDEEHKYLWPTSAVDGKQYLIPQIYDWQNPYVAVIRGDLRKKYGIEEIKTYDDLIAYAEAIGTNEPGLIPINTSGTADKMQNAFFSSIGWVGAGPSAISFDTVKNDGKVFNILETPEVIEYAKDMRRLQENGVFPKDVLSNKTSLDDAFKAGTAAMSVDGFGGPLNTYIEVSKTHPEYEAEIVDFLADMPKSAPSALAGGMAVNAGAKHPERTLMAYDLLMGVQEYNDLLGLGVEGTHWEDVGEGQYKLLDAGTTNYAPYAGCPWGLNTNLMRNDESVPEFATELREKWAEQVEVLVTDGFVFNDTNVKNELTAITAIYTAEWPSITFGLHEDPEKAVSDLNTKLKNAGIDKVLAEVQSQLDEYIASSK